MGVGVGAGSGWQARGLAHAKVESSPRLSSIMKKSTYVMSGEWWAVGGG